MKKLKTIFNKQSINDKIKNCLIGSVLPDKMSECFHRLLQVYESRDDRLKRRYLGWRNAITYIVVFLTCLFFASLMALIVVQANENYMLRGDLDEANRENANYVEICKEAKYLKY